MTEHGLIIPVWKVQAFQRGATQMRVRLKKQPIEPDGVAFFAGEWHVGRMRDSENAWQKMRQQFRVGDRFWVKETWRPVVSENQYGLFDYRADYGASNGGLIPWRSSSSMPRLASRIGGIIKSVRCERVNEISDADCIAEGCHGSYSPAYVAGGEICGPDGQMPHEEFRENYESTHGPGSFDRDWAWVLDLERVTT